jgi:hypothetical protein
MLRGSLFAVIAFAVVAVASASGSPPERTTASSVRLDGLPPLNLVNRGAVDWCGNVQSTAVDRKPETDISSTRQVHVTYAVPADAPDQFASFASKIASDAAAMDAWWRGQDPTRTIRFDLFAFPGCGSKAGKLDIGFVRLPRVGSLYMGDAGVDRLLGDLTQLDALSSQKHLVYYDGPNVFDQFVCGTSFVTSSSPSQGGLSGIAFVWLRSLCGGDVGAAGLNAAVAVHELIHGLGSMVQPGAPHECPSPDDGHVCDATDDILYPSVTSQSRLATQVLDVGRDDYYGHSGTWFDVQDSPWLSHLPQHNLSLTIAKPASAIGAVRINSPTASECGQTCSLDVDQGITVALAAVPGKGSRFLGWRGACSGTGACSVSMDAAKTVTAAFGVALFRLNVSVSGVGRVSSSPAGVSCPARCSATFQASKSVRLKPKPASGYRFAGWTGSCHGSGSCVVNMTRNRSVKATFRKK